MPTSSHPPPRPPALRSWRLAALVLAVLAAHGLVLTHWLARHDPPAAPDPRASALPTVPPGSSIEVVAAPDTSPTPPAGASANASRPATERPAAPENKGKEPPALDIKPTNAIYTVASITPKQSAPPVAGPAPALAPPTVPSAMTTPSAPSAPAEPPGPAATAPGKLQMPPSMTLQYDVKATRKGVTLPASSTLRFTHDGTQYDARLEIKALMVGSRTQTSKGTIDPVAGLQPVRFGDKTKSEQATHFDRSLATPALRFSANTPDIPLQPHTQDRLSVLFQLAAMLAGDAQRVAQQQPLIIHTAGTKDADLWQFRIAPADTLHLPAGTMTAVHLIRKPLHAYDNQVEVWLAPDLHHLPVRVLWTQANGDVVDQRLTGHSP